MATPTTLVRVGTLRDLDAVMALAIAAGEENGFVRVTPARLLNDVYPALVGDRGIIGVIGQPPTLEGFVLLRFGKMNYSDADVVEEKAIFVRPEFRTGKTHRAKMLAQFSKAVSDKTGLPLLIGVLSNQRTAGKVRMYEREFGPPAGAFWLYNAKTGAAA